VTVFYLVQGFDSDRVRVHSSPLTEPRDECH